MNRKALRPAVFKRDSGICCKCHADTEAIIHNYRKDNGETKENAIVALLWEWGLSPKGKTLWHNDHVIPIAAGGMDTLDNCQTLCAICHRNKTSNVDVPLITKVNRKRKKNQEHQRRMREKGI